MVFQLKIKNKFALNSTRKSAGTLELILSKVKFVAKNVIYVKKWSKNLKVEELKKIDYSSDDFEKSISSTSNTRGIYGLIILPG